MRAATIGGQRLELNGRRLCGMENWSALRRLVKAGYLRAVWVRRPLPGMEYRLTAAGEAEAGTR